MLESFILESIFIILFTERCPLLVDPLLCAAIFNYLEEIPIDFCTKYSNQLDFLNQPDMQNFLKECKGNNNIQLNNTSDENLQILSGIMHYFCDYYKVDIGLAKYHLVQGTFEIICNEKYYKTSINLGAYIIEHMLERVLDRLDIKVHKFFQMINYDNHICEYY